MKKRYLYHNKDFYYELEPDLFYLTSDKKTITMVRIPTQEEIDFPDEFDIDEIEFHYKGEEDNSQIFVEVHSWSVKEFLKIADKLRLRYLTK